MNAKWTPDTMKKAMHAVRQCNVSQKKAAEQFGVPRQTLRRHLAGTNKYAPPGEIKLGRPPVLRSDMEDDLKEHVLLLESMLFGVSQQTLKKLAFQIATKNNVAGAKQFNAEKASAGRYWLQSFLKRNPELSIRTAEGTSIARASGFSKKSVTQFFDIYIPLTDQLSLTPDKIYNMDETSLSTVQRPEKVIARKGKSQVGAITSAERGTSVTCVSCMNAAGSYVPPMLIFKRKRMVEQLKKGAPCGTCFEVQDKGWMDTTVFYKWLQHFIKNVKPSIDNPLLLILDGHSSHVSNLEAVNLARDSGVIMISLPPHCTHRMQPLDIGYFKPFKTYYHRAVDNWMRTHPGRCVSVYEVAALLNEAFEKSSVVGHAVHAFEKAGLWPPNRHVFTEEDFIATSIAIASQTSEPSAPQTQEPTVMALTIDSISIVPQTAESITTAPQTSESIAIDPPSDTSVEPLNIMESSLLVLPETSVEPSNIIESSPLGLQESSVEPSNIMGSSRLVLQEISIEPSNIIESSTLGLPESFVEPSNIAESSPLGLPKTSGTAQSVSESISKQRVINIPGDGKCFFRSTVIATTTKLQTAERDAQGVPNSPLLQLLEEAETEKLRSSLIVFMSNKIESYSNLSTDVLNADLPPQFHCETVMDRIMLAAKADSCVGELEIIATAEMTNKTIMVVNKKYEVIRVYNNVPDRLRQDLIILMFMNLSDTTGHFEPVVVTVETSNPLTPTPSIENTCVRMFSDENKSLVRAKEILPIPRKSPKVATRKRRCQIATVLTASPHKKHLEGKAMTKKAPKQRKQKPKNVGLSSKPAEDWSCMICGENIKESMTQCIGCGRWTHDMCTNQANLNHYICDLCV